MASRTLRLPGALADFLCTPILPNGWVVEPILPNPAPKGTGWVSVRVSSSRCYADDASMVRALRADVERLPFRFDPAFRGRLYFAGLRND